METWMSFVGLSMSVGAIPQAIRLWQKKSSEEISLLMWLIVVHGIAWWLYYGITIKSMSLIITNSFCLCIYSIIVTLTILYRLRPGKVKTYD